MCSFEFSDRWVSCPHFNHIKTTCEHPENKTGECEEMDCPTLPQIRVLAVRQPWASLIIEGLKTIEVRSRNTNIRGPVAIYAGNHLPTEGEKYNFLKMIYDMEFYSVISHEDRKTSEDILYGSEYGKIVGTVEIVDSTHTCKTVEDFISEQKKHWSDHLQKTGKGEYKSVFWHLKNPVKFADPVKLSRWPSGGPWAKVPKSILSEICNKMYFDKEDEAAVSEKRM